MGRIKAREESIAFDGFGIELYEKVRSKNPSRACRNFIPIEEGRGTLTIFERQNPGMVVKNASSAWSSSRATNICSMTEASISEDGFDAVSSATFHIPGMKTVTITVAQATVALPSTIEEDI